MSEIVTVVVPVATAGADGAAVGSAQTPALNGFLLDIHFDFHASAPATTDTTVAYSERGGNIVVVTSSVTDVLLAPRMKPVDNANAAITNAFEKFPLNGRLTISLAQCNELAVALTAYVRYLRG